MDSCILVSEVLLMVAMGFCAFKLEVVYKYCENTEVVSPFLTCLTCSNTRPLDPLLGLTDVHPVRYGAVDFINAHGFGNFLLDVLNTLLIFLFVLKIVRTSCFFSVLLILYVVLSMHESKIFSIAPSSPIVSCC